MTRLVIVGHAANWSVGPPVRGEVTPPVVPMVGQGWLSTRDRAAPMARALRIGDH